MLGSTSRILECCSNLDLRPASPGARRESSELPGPFGGNRFGMLEFRDTQALGLELRKQFGSEV